MGILKLIKTMTGVEVEGTPVLNVPPTKKDILTAHLGVKFYGGRALEECYREWSERLKWLEKVKYNAQVEREYLPQEFLDVLTLAKSTTALLKELSLSWPSNSCDLPEYADEYLDEIKDTTDQETTDPEG